MCVRWRGGGGGGFLLSALVHVHGDAQLAIAPLYRFRNSRPRRADLLTPTPQLGYTAETMEEKVQAFWSADENKDGKLVHDEFITCGSLSLSSPSLRQSPLSPVCETHVSHRNRSCHTDLKGFFNEEDEEDDIVAVINKAFFPSDYLARFQ